MRAPGGCRGEKDDFDTRCAVRRRVDLHAAYPRARRLERHRLIECDWAHTAPLANLTASLLAVQPSASLPVPVGAAASVPYPVGHQVTQLRVGGLSSAGAWRQWVAAFLPVNDSGAAAGVLHQPQEAAGWTVARPGAGGVVNGRRGLPLRFEVGEDELNGSGWSAGAGAPLVVTHTLPSHESRVQSMYTTAHLQASNQANSVAQRTIHLWHAADAPNSSRQLFDFATQRTGHGQGYTWDQFIVSGGLTDAGRPSNDWITYTPPQCLHPTDPSYGSLLGPGLTPRSSAGYLVADPAVNLQFRLHYSTSATIEWQDAAQYLPGDRLRWRCADGYRFEPRSGVGVSGAQLSGQRAVDGRAARIDPPLRQKRQRAGVRVAVVGRRVGRVCGS